MSDWTAVRYVTIDKKRIPSAYARAQNVRSEVYLGMSGRWVAWKLPVDRTYATAEEAMAAVEEAETVKTVEVTISERDYEEAWMELRAIPRSETNVPFWEDLMPGEREEFRRWMDEQIGNQLDKFPI